jgi:hypothetical protein
MVKNHNNADTRCGAILELKLNCNYIMEVYAEEHGDGELTFRGHAEDEEHSLEEFWKEYNQRILNILSNHGSLSLNDDQGRDYLVDTFQIHLHDWKVNFEWKLYETEEPAENREYRFPDGKSWEEHYDTYEKFIQAQVKHFQLFADLVPLGLVEDPLLKPVIEKVIADAKDALTKCPNKTAVIMKNYWENEMEEWLRDRGIKEFRSACMKPPPEPDSDDEEAVGVHEITVDGKKYLYDPEDNEIFDWLKYMEDGETEQIGILADVHRTAKPAVITDDYDRPIPNKRFIHYDDLMVHISDGIETDKGTKTYYTKDEFFGDGHYATDTNDNNIEVINDWCDQQNVGGDAARRPTY